MSDLEKLCFILSCRETINKTRRAEYHKYYSLERQFRRNATSKYTPFCPKHFIKFHEKTNLTKKMLKHQQEYRKIADFMTRQKPVLRAARKVAGYRINYDSNNSVRYIVNIENADETYDLKRIKEIAAGYTFDKIVLVDGINPLNPYEMK